MSTVTSPSPWLPKKLCRVGTVRDDRGGGCHRQFRLTDSGIFDGIDQVRQKLQVSCGLTPGNRSRGCRQPDYLQRRVQQGGENREGVANAWIRVNDDFLRQRASFVRFPTLSPPARASGRIPVSSEMCEPCQLCAFWQTIS